MCVTRVLNGTHRHTHARAHTHACTCTHTHVQAAEANKDKRVSDALKHHKQARSCNIILLVLSIIEGMILVVSLTPVIVLIETLNS